MFRYFAHEADIIDKKISIEGSDANHLKNILRAELGGEVCIVTEECEYVSKIININEFDLLCEIVKKVKNNNEAKTNITLCQSLPKQTKMETVIQMNVELGVKRFIPLLTKRCIVKLNEVSRVNKKLDRWRKVSHESSKQSRRNVVPEVTAVFGLKDIVKLAEDEGATILVPYERENHMQIKDAVGDGNNYFIVIGPEGGFAEEEIVYLIENGARVVTLGKRILRTQTAGLVAATCIFYEKGDLK